MEIIPFYCQMPPLVILVFAAAHRRNLFPFVLTSMCAAFVYLIHLSNQYNLSFMSQLVLSATLAAMLCEVALNSKRRKYIKRFCAVMILSILNQILMYSLSFIDAGFYYVAAQASTAVVTALISLAELYILLRIIYGTGRGEPITTAFGIYIMDCLSIFTPNQKALCQSVWQKGTANNYSRTAGQR